MDRQIFVYVDLNNTPHLAGRLWLRVRNRTESATFQYDPASSPAHGYLMLYVDTAQGYSRTAKVQDVNALVREAAQAPTAASRQRPDDIRDVSWLGRRLRLSDVKRMMNQGLRAPAKPVAIEHVSRAAERVSGSFAIAIRPV